MPTKKIKKEEVPVVETCECVKPPIEPIKVEFGNGDMNVLRDKINELISLNR